MKEIHTMEKIMIKIFDAKPSASHIVSLNLFLCLSVSDGGQWVSDGQQSESSSSPTRYHHQRN